MNTISNKNSSNTIGRFARERANCPIAPTCIGFQFGDVFSTVQAKCLRDRALRNVWRPAELLDLKHWLML